MSKMSTVSAIATAAALFQSASADEPKLPPVPANSKHAAQSTNAPGQQQGYVYQQRAYGTSSASSSPSISQPVQVTTNYVPVTVVPAPPAYRTIEQLSKYERDQLRRLEREVDGARKHEVNAELRENRAVGRTTGALLSGDLKGWAKGMGRVTETSRNHGSQQSRLAVAEERLRLFKERAGLEPDPLPHGR